MTTMMMVIIKGISLLVLCDALKRRVIIMFAFLTLHWLLAAGCRLPAVAHKWPFLRSNELYFYQTDTHCLLD